MTDKVQPAAGAGQPSEALAGPGPEEELLTPERTAKVAAFIDDPCDEGGFDQFCRNSHGQLCRFHAEWCHAPDYPCIDRLRHFLAVSFLEEIAARRASERRARKA